MAEAKASTRAGATDECLHCAIIDMLEERAGGSADAANLFLLIAESLVDVILLVPESEQAQLMAHTLSALGDLFLQKSSLDGNTDPSGAERGQERDRGHVREGKDRDRRLALLSASGNFFRRLPCPSCCTSLAGRPGSGCPWASS
jgi:hypothetical protein